MTTPAPSQTAPRRHGTISGLLLRPLPAALSGHPAALEAFFGATDLTPERLGDADMRVTPATFCVAWAEALRLSKDPHLALTIATMTPPGAFGVVEYVCRAAPTLGAALAQWVRYLNLLDDAVTVRLIVDGGAAFLRVVHESEAPAPASHELCFALLCRRASTTRPFVPERVDFTHRTTGDPAAYSRFFGAPVVFGAGATQLVLRRADLDLALTSADLALNDILSRHADHLEAQDRSSPPLTAQVRRTLAAALERGDTQVDMVARTLGMSGRTLQRRLEDEGTSFQSLREALRQQLATRYLDEARPIAEITFLLGFSEPSAFFRAFKRWTGQTPLERRGLRVSSAV